MNDKKPSSYAKAGVDIRKENLAIKGISGWLEKTFKFREGKVGAVLKDIGGYANLVDLGSTCLAMTTDGVGSKVLVAQELDKYDTVGIDCIAMNVNDLICVGAEPIAMVDYLAVQSISQDTASEISIGLYEGAQQAGIAIIGGETATLPEVICGIGNKGFDLAGTAIGIVEKDKIITGDAIKPGDAVIGIESSGIHSNGLTLARKVIPKNMWSQLLKPTRIYVKEILSIINEFPVHGLANITGSAFLKLTRITKHGFVLDNMPEPELIFKKMQELGCIPDEEMYKTFNMGVGFCVVTDAETAQEIVGKYKTKYKLDVIGRIVEEPGVTIKLKGKEFKLN
ncbi:MAG: phosphoribosylformylglycinamidine cyclo-ligase [Candidatus Altiarchaeota archaeon]